MKRFVLLFCLYTLPIMGICNKYYISSSGNDANSGLTQALAWQTISKVNSFSFSAGDSIYFNGGDVFTGWIRNNSFKNATVSQRILISSYGTGKATINSGLNEGLSIENAGNITVSNLIFQGSGYKVSDLWLNGVGIYIDTNITNYCDNIYIDNVEAYGYGGWGILVSGESKTYGYRHLRLTNNLVHDNGTGGLIVYGPTDTITKTNFITHKDVYIGYCKAYNNWGRLDYTLNWSGSGILIAAVETGLVEYCEAYSNGKENGSGYAGPVGIFIGDSKYVTIQNCISHHNLGGPAKKDGGGFDLDQGSSNCVIQNCESYENEGAGYGLYQAPTNNAWEYDTVRNNKSTNDGRNYGIYGAITFWGSSATYKISKAQVYNNQVNLSKTGYGLIFLNSNLSEVQVTDNIFCLESPSSYLNYSTSNPIPVVASVTNSTFPCNVQPQASLITPVTYRGAFAPSPTPMWTTGWTNYDPQNFAYPAADSIIQTNITTNLTLSGSKTYLLKGLIYVTNNAILKVPAGCVFRADHTIPNTSLVITAGAKIIAAGTSSNPIVFTSDKAAGSRTAGDWGGLIILGKGQYNGTGGEGYTDGIAPVNETKFGGGTLPLINDNSGTLQFVRIEFAGYKLSSVQKIHGLVFGAVGKGTTADHIQVSYCANNAFQFVGGSVYCKNLVAYKNTEDNWNATNGYTGAVQFCLGLRDPSIAADPVNTTSESLESNNDAAGSDATAFTSAMFCNITEIGPLRGNVNAVVATGYKRGIRFSNNSHLKVLNSILMDFPSGVFVDGAACTSLANGSNISPVPNKSPGKLAFKNNLVAGTKAGKTLEKNISWDMAQWFGVNKNDSLASTANLLVSPYATTGSNVYAGDYRPANGSAALLNYNWNDSAFFNIDSSGTVSTLISCPSSVPVPPAVIGNASPCTYMNSGDTAKYYVQAKNIYGILSYQWTVPAGVTIESGQGTDTLVVRFINTYSTGNIGVQHLTYCGVFSSSKTLTVKKLPPATPGTITGTTNVCQNINGPAVTYSIAPVTYASGYNWTVPAGATIVSTPPYTTSINVSYSGSFVSGNVAVQALSPCGNSSFKTLGISKGIPSTPGNISGLTNVCQYIGGADVTYSISAVTNATGYNWTVPAGATITSQQPYTTSINVKFSASFVSGNISVQALSACGNSAFKALAVSKGIPATPGTISGLTNVCQNIGGPEVTYSIAAVTYATGYNWTAPSGATITSAQPYSTSITVLFSSGFVSGNISVQALGLCGNSAFKTLAISKGPATPGTITGPTNVCQNIDGPAVTYSIAAVSNATGYNWTVPAGATITSQQPYSTSITVSFTGAFVSGNISVQALGLCGNSAFKTLAVSKGQPATPGTISGPTNVCQNIGGAAVTYSIAAVSNATGYNWTVPAGATITSQPPYTTSITVSFTNAFVSGNISVQALGLCANSAFKTLAVSKGIPGTPGSITGPANVCTYIGGPAATYSIASVTFATGYNWTVPAGATITSSQPYTTSITVSFSSSFVSGNVSVQALGLCGNSAFKSLAVSKGIPSTPGTISGPSFVCANIDGPAVTYSISAVTNATGYVWTVPSGATITSSLPYSTSVTVAYSSAFTSGNVGVQATSACGNSAVKTLAVTKLAGTPTTLTGPISSCKYVGVPVTYATTAVANASSYTWTVPAGAAINGSSTGTSISVTYSTPVAGTVTVKANTACGSSAVKSLTVSSVATPLSITGTAAVCRSQTQSYTVNDTANSASATYTWTPPTGVTITSGQGTKTVTVSIGATFTSGSLGVKATACAITGGTKSLAFTLAANCPASAITLAPQPQFLEKSMDVFPNPSNGNFSVRFNSQSKTGILRLEILSATGKLVSERTIANYQGNVQFNVREFNLLPGMYLIRCSSGKITETEKLVILPY